MSQPWMPLYIADYLADTSRLSTLEHGAYLLLIMDYWRNGSLPDDDRKLARIVRLSAPEWAAIRDDLAELFQPGWKHKRIDAELERSASKSEKAKASGSVGARAKWGVLDLNAATRAERLTNARRLATHSSEEWEALVDFCGRKCVKCGSGNRIVKDHIRPIYAGGSDGMENLQPLCVSCNSAKGPEQIDYRPEGWRAASRMPSKRLPNASLSQPQSQLDTPSLPSITAPPPKERGDILDCIEKVLAAYPRSKTNSQPKALAAIQATPVSDWPQLIAACAAYAADFRAKPTTHPIALDRFIRERIFANYSPRDAAGPVLVTIEHDSPAGRAWDAHERRIKGKPPPWTNGRWHFPAAFPPNHPAHETRQ